MIRQIFQIIKVKMRFSSQRREMLMFLTTNMAAVTIVQTDNRVC